MRRLDSFPQLLHAYFYDWMARQRNASRHTVLSYRDAWRLFLRFVAQRCQKDVANVLLSDLTPTAILAFLDHLEKDRNATIATRNCRLAALHSFFTFLADREPLATAQCDAVLRIPVKRGPKRSLHYLEEDEVKAILAQPDQKTLRGQRDYTLLSLLYNTGARISEILELTPKAVRLEPPAYIKIIGKGRKERLTPLWPETAELLSALLKRRPRREDEPIFVNRYGQPLRASGVRFLLAQYVRAATTQLPRLAEKNVSPHSFRHACAVSLLAHGVDITIVRDWLGHVSLDTTMTYTHTTLENKRKALEQLDSTVLAQRPSRWQSDAGVLAWLDSL
jgi:site-specific recombinase XerD